MVMSIVLVRSFRIDWMGRCRKSRLFVLGAKIEKIAFGSAKIESAVWDLPQAASIYRWPHLFIDGPASIYRWPHLLIDAAASIYR